MSMVSRTLTKAETELWESADDRIVDEFRREVRGEDYPVGTHVEIYSHDGITLDAWEVEVQA